MVFYSVSKTKLLSGFSRHWSPQVLDSDSAIANDKVYSKNLGDFYNNVGAKPVNVKVDALAEVTHRSYSKMSALVPLKRL